MQYNFRLSLAALAVANVLTTSAHANVIISEYIEGSSNNKAIELVNLSDSTVDLSSYTLETYANGRTTANTPVLTLSGNLAPKATFVIGHSSAVDAIKTKSQLLNGLGFNGDDALVLKKNGVVVDSFGRVGEQPRPAWGTGLTSSLDKSLRRKNSVTTGDVIVNDAFDPATEYNGADRDDFSDLGLYNGQAGGVVEVPKYQHGNCGESVTLISAVQGSGAESPLKGQTVTLEAVVTASMPGKDGLGGFYVQQTEATYDSDANTSEGIFVVDTQSAVSVAVGQKVRVSGVVEEGFNQTQLNKLEGLSICGTEPLPAAKTIALPMATTTAFEPLEGMLVKTEQSLVVTDNYGLGRYNEVVLATERLFIPTQIAKPGDASKAIEAQNALNQITLDDGKNKQNIDTPYPATGLTAENTLRVGDTVEPLTAVLGYGFSKYRLHPVTAVNVTATNPRTQTPVFAKPGDYQIASFNVLNYFNGDGAGAGYPTARGASTAVEFTKQRAKVIAAIAALNADVVGLLEVENDGFAATSALQDLINGLNENAKADVWAFVDLKAAQVGTDAITSAIIYRKDKVEEAATAAFTTTAPFDYGNRAPVAQAFRHKVSGDTVQVVVAHLRSKGSCPKDKTDVANIDSGDGQGCWNGNRVEAAKQLSAWLATNPTQLTLPTGQSATAQPTLILGDINAYLMEDPITAFADNGYTEVSNALHGPKQYSYVFGGESGSLDHAFANESLMAKISDVTEWHINADEPLILDYNEEFKSETAKANFYAATPYRSSDHDPMIVSVKFSRPSIQAQNFTLSENATENALVGTLSASGLKPIANYRLSGVDAAMFSINAKGEIRLAAGANPDFETKSKLELTVVAEQQGGLLSAPVALNVMITDEAELPTLTIAETNTAIMVDAPQGTVVAQLTAKAVDETATVKSITLTGGNGYAVENNAIVVKGSPAVGTTKLTVTVTDSKGKTTSKTLDVYAAGTENAGGSMGGGLMAMLAGLLVWRRRTSSSK